LWGRLSFEISELGQGLASVRTPLRTLIAYPDIAASGVSPWQLPTLPMLVLKREPMATAWSRPAQT
jgi:hypothetical protein